MSNQPENEMQQTLTPEEVRQYMLAEIEATTRAVTELSNEELEAIRGGGGVLGKCAGCGNPLEQTYSAPSSPRTAPPRSSWLHPEDWSPVWDSWEPGPRINSAERLQERTTNALHALAQRHMKID
jgi:hypothetical protein